MDYLNAFLCGGILCAIGQIFIDKTQLTPREKAWLDGYHARIRRIISPLVDPQTAEWLAAACAPL